MKYYSRRIIKHADLNPSNRLFGGQLLSWIDEEAAIFAACQMKTDRLVTKVMSEIDFKSSAKLGEIIEFGFEVVHVGTTSLTVKCLVRNKSTLDEIIEVDKIVFVAMDEDGNPVAHNASQGEVA